MVAVNVLKGGSALLRNYGGGGGSVRPLLPTCCSLSCNYYHCQVKGNGNGFGKWKMMVGGRPFSLSPLSVSLQNSECTAASASASSATASSSTEATGAARRVFCTAFHNMVDSPSSLSETPSSPSSSSSSSSSSTVVGDDDDDQLMIKNAANTLDIRVGRILRAWRHEEADSLYVEEVDIGEPEPRIICSGLVNYIPLDHLQDQKVVVLANLKPRNMRGIKSFGMLMAASDASHENVELLVPPEGSLPGERIWFGSADEKENLPDTASPNQIQKKKIWELVQPHLKTDTSCVAALGMHFMRTSAGVVVCGSLKNANIS